MRSRKAEFCAQHAAEGMVNVAHKKCGDDGVKTQPSFGVVGSRKAEFCARHAAEGMINVVNKKFGHDGCTTQPSFGVVGSRKAEFCARHAAEGMINVVNKNVATMVARRNRPTVLCVAGRRNFVPGLPPKA